MDSLIRTNTADWTENSSLDCQLQLLKRNQRKGSKPRCHALTRGPRKEAAKRLTELMGSVGFVREDDFWMPDGFERLDEAQLHNSPCLLDVTRYGDRLKGWWLAEAGSKPRTPNWDIASTCTIEGKPGLLLVEAKAHIAELKADDRCGARSAKNLHQISAAIREANDALNLIRPGWGLSHETHYQLSNRFAWSWKLASLGIPVVLVYLGFLNADKMKNPFKDEQAWEKAVREYADKILPESIWGDILVVNCVPIYPLIRSTEISLNRVGIRTI